MNKYQVIVGNIGTIYDGDNLKEAAKEFENAMFSSEGGYGRMAGESVTLWADGEPDHEFQGSNDTQ